MPIELITGTAGYAHVDSADVGAFNVAALGNSSYIMSGGGCTIVNANTARVAAAELLLQGRHVRLNAQGVDATIDNGDVGKNRNDLICVHYRKISGIESAAIEVLKGTPVIGTQTDPDIPSGSILDGDPSAWIPLYRVTILGLVPQTPERMISLADNIPLIDHKHAAGDITSGIIAISRGGTGASSAASALSNLGLTATAEELNYCDGVTSNIQTQLNNKAESSHNHDASNITSGILPVERGGTGGSTGAVKIAKLWSNASPSSDFYAQTVSIENASSYGFFIIIFIGSKGNPSTKIPAIITTTNTKVTGISAEDAIGFNEPLFYRDAYATSTSIYFGYGYSCRADGSFNEMKHGRCIPVTIYGVKF